MIALISAVLGVFIIVANDFAVSSILSALSSFNLLFTKILSCSNNQSFLCCSLVIHLKEFHFLIGFMLFDFNKAVFSIQTPSLLDTRFILAQIFSAISSIIFSD